MLNTLLQCQLQGQKCVLFRHVYNTSIFIVRGSYFRIDLRSKRFNGWSVDSSNCSKHSMASQRELGDKIQSVSSHSSVEEESRRCLFDIKSPEASYDSANVRFSLFCVATRSTDNFSVFDWCVSTPNGPHTRRDSQSLCSGREQHGFGLNVQEHLLLL